MNIKATIIRFLYGLPLWLGLLCCIKVMGTEIDYLAVKKPISSEKMRMLIEGISTDLREAVNAANSYVKFNENNENGIDNSIRVYFKKSCFNSIQRAIDSIDLLRDFFSSAAHQNISGNRTAFDGGAAFVASGNISEHLRDIEHSGLACLRKDLTTLIDNLQKKDHIMPNDIEQVMPNDIEQVICHGKTDPDLLSCGIFWEQLIRAGSPSFKESYNICLALDAMMTRCMMIAGEQMSPIQRATIYSKIAPEKGSLARKVTDFLSLTTSQEEKIQADRTFANELLPMVERRIDDLKLMRTAVEKIKKEIVSSTALKNEVVGCDKLEIYVYDGASQQLEDAHRKLIALKTRLGKLCMNNDEAEKNDLSIATVHEVLKQIQSNITEFDQKMRTASAGLFSVIGLTFNQRKNLEQIRSRKMILPSSFSGLYESYVNIMEMVREGLPQGDLASYKKMLTCTLASIEQNRSVIPQVVPYEPQPEHQSLRADWGWIGRYGVPSVVPSFRGVLGKSDALLNKFELLRTIFSEQLQNLKKGSEWLWPMNSLDNAISLSDVEFAPKVKNDYEHRKFRISEKAKKEEMIEKELEKRVSVLKQIMIWQIKYLKGKLTAPRGIFEVFSQESGSKVVKDSFLNRLYLFEDSLNCRKCDIASNENCQNCDIASLNEHCKCLHDREPILEEDHKLTTDEANNIRAISEGLRGNIKKYVLVFPKKEVDSNGAKEENLHTSDSWNKWIVKVSNAVKTVGAENFFTRSIEDIMEPYKKSWEDYVRTEQLDDRLENNTIPTLFAGIVRAACSEKHKVYKNHQADYNRSVMRKGIYAIKLYKYSFISRQIFAPLARRCGIEWGKKIYNLKIGLQTENESISSNLYNLQQSHENYKNFYKLCLAADTAQFMAYKKTEDPPLVIRDSANMNFVLNRYFNLPSIPLNDSQRFNASHFLC